MPEFNDGLEDVGRNIIRAVGATLIFAVVGIAALIWAVA